MIKFEYDVQTAGCMVSFLLLDEDFGHVPPLKTFDILPEESQPTVSPWRRRKQV